MSLSELRTQNKTWILTRFRLQMERYPKCGDTVTVETWASSRTNGIRAVREFRFADSANQTLGRAASVFLMMDAARKRPVRLPQVVLDLANHERSNPEEFETPRLSVPADVTRTHKIPVLWKDLDVNNHANNVSYMDWALEALSLETNRDKTLEQFDIEFLAEAFYGDEISSQAEVSDTICRHQLISQRGTLLALAVTRWQ